MSRAETSPLRQLRADARVNHDKLVAAARALFTEKSTSAPLEEVAEGAGVGIGTLYRHFPTRQALLEAVYVDEVEAMARSAADLAQLPPGKPSPSGCTSTSASPLPSEHSTKR
jgi:AcrR family transcriptional regulator